jgi:hypothetical protein
MVGAVFPHFFEHHLYPIKCKALVQLMELHPHPHTLRIIIHLLIGLCLVEQWGVFLRDLSAMGRHLPSLATKSIRSMVIHLEHRLPVSIHNNNKACRLAS